jgi:hypothetical protein
MNNKQIVIGVGGVARAGKNLFCDLLVKQLKQQYNLHAQHFALAYELKMDCRQFIWDKFNIDVFTENTDEKKIFRDMLVWYGDAKRKQSNGRYWIDKLNNRIGKEFAWGTPPINVAIISDIRYDFYENDEVDFIRKEKNGPFIHISKYTYGFPTDGRVVKVGGQIVNNTKIFTDPANSHEALNDPKLQKKADYLLQWEDIGVGKNLTYAELLDNQYLNNSVTECLKSIQHKIIQ